MENPDRNEIRSILQQSKKIAVVGLSDNPARTSYSVSKAMQDAGYEIIPVNPMIKEALGVQAVPSLKDLPESVDIVNVFRRSEFLKELADDYLETDAPVFWTQLDVIDEEVYQKLTDKGRKVIMDRCIKVEHSITRP
ncbi:putative CoA-binding protein YneT [Jeotgalibacillus alimentarius]|uniref:Putative CoA-binding protein YneT n=1 Tax=Jeotgalibacillus alimentarius TaxID=135826 RepID=A0A0C2VWI0_9BACL|nr:CoA-binding protein [Jeotgalibacillus alimentarius]KIL48766.1 putative CoA-binding protein YneT [Jeotgalibacillus alimentarius]